MRHPWQKMVRPWNAGEESSAAAVPVFRNLRRGGKTKKREDKNPQLQARKTIQDNTRWLLYDNGCCAANPEQTAENNKKRHRCHTFRAGQRSSRRSTWSCKGVKKALWSRSPRYCGCARSSETGQAETKINEQHQQAPKKMIEGLSFEKNNNNRSNTDGGMDRLEAEVSPSSHAGHQGHSVFAPAIGRDCATLAAARAHYCCSGARGQPNSTRRNKN